MADTPAKAAEGADFIFTCVGNDNDLREVATGENGLFNTAKAGSIFIDNSTVSAEVSRELYKAAKDKGFDFLDAPISGGQSGAEGGILTVMVGGDEEVFKKAEPVIDCYSKKVKLIGSCGSGQLTKMMNQMCIAGAVQGLSDVTRLASTTLTGGFANPGVSTMELLSSAVLSMLAIALPVLALSLIHI